MIRSEMVGQEKLEPRSFRTSQLCQEISVPVVPTGTAKVNHTCGTDHSICWFYLDVSRLPSCHRFHQSLSCIRCLLPVQTDNHILLLFLHSLTLYTFIFLRGSVPQNQICHQSIQGYLPHPNIIMNQICGNIQLTS